MSIQSEKLKLIQLLINTDNQSILEQVKAIFQTSNQKDIWLKLTETQQMVINNSIEENLNEQTVGLPKSIFKI